MNNANRMTGDLLIKAAELPWVPQGENIWFKPLRISPDRGTWVNLLKVSRSGVISRHRHLGAVEALVLNGSWRYLEHDWTANAGDFVYEGPGDVHTLSVVGEEEMLTLFHINGPLEYLDANDNLERVETADTKLALYTRYCEENNLELHPVVFE